MTPPTMIVAKVLLRNRHGQFLILRIGQHFAKPTHSYKPDLPGGIIEGDESVRQGLIRETIEETGITLNHDTIRMIYTETAYSKDDSAISIRLLYAADCDEEKVVINWEHDCYLWLDRQELEATEFFHPFYNRAVAFYLAHHS